MHRSKSGSKTCPKTGCLLRFQSEQSRASQDAGALKLGNNLCHQFDWIKTISELEIHAKTCFG